MNPLRVEVRELMAEIHLIPPELAEYFVQQMDDVEVERRFKMYTGMELRRLSGPVFREADGAIGNLTINGMGNRAGN